MLSVVQAGLSSPNHAMKTEEWSGRFTLVRPTIIHALRSLHVAAKIRFREAAPQR